MNMIREASGAEDDGQGFFLKSFLKSAHEEIRNNFLIYFFKCCSERTRQMMANMFQQMKIKK